MPPSIELVEVPKLIAKVAKLSPEQVAKLERERKAQARKLIREGKAWAKPITQTVCRRCPCPCCVHMHVMLDCEAAERRLHEFKGAYEYTRMSRPTAILVSLGRKNNRAPFLKKRKDGSCIFFDRDKHKCTIQDRKPAACRSFFCGRGTKRDYSWKRLKEERKKCQNTKTR